MALSRKQLDILAFPATSYTALICDGAIRSGKTVFMTIAFVDDAMRRYNNQRFGICGKTVDSAIKNIIKPYLTAKKYQKSKGYDLKWKLSEKTLAVTRGSVTNYFEVFGGKDESSFMLIQGRTLAGVFLDEVALQPQSFVLQALGRCSVTGSRYWFNCNPDSPQHWFYLEWICNLKKHNALHLHFQLEDNPSLSPETIQRYHNDYSGVFYQRYILGEWVVAEGLVYDFGAGNITNEKPETGVYYISIDYGTLNPFSAGLWCLNADKAVRIEEYYYSGRESKRNLTDGEYLEAVKELVAGREIQEIIVDPSAASFIALLREAGYRVRKAKNDVLDGIRTVSNCLKNGNIKIHEDCKSCIREFKLYRWDEKATEDKVIKENDHCLTGDTLVDLPGKQVPIKDLVGKAGLVWSYGKTLRPFYNVRKTGEKKKIIKITLEDGRTIRCTPDHLILTEAGWKEAEEAKTILDAEKRALRIKNIEPAGEADVYNMEVSGTHCFAVNDGLIVHNCMDETRYFCYTVLRYEINRPDESWLYK